jgi:hypothetical protein
MITDNISSGAAIFELRLLVSPSMRSEWISLNIRVRAHRRGISSCVNEMIALRFPVKGAKFIRSPIPLFRHRGSHRLISGSLLSLRSDCEPHIPSAANSDSPLVTLSLTTGTICDPS